MQGCIRYRDIIEPYMPDRVLRQLGRVQCIPASIIIPDSAFRPGANVATYDVQYSASLHHYTWFNFPRCSGMDVRSFDVVADPTSTTADYMSWYTHHSHPRLLRAPAPTPSDDLSSAQQVRLHIIIILIMFLYNMFYHLYI